MDLAMAVRLPVAAMVGILALASCPKGPAPSGAPLPAHPTTSAHPAQQPAGDVPSQPEPGRAAADRPASRIDFAIQVQPILEARCQPCHFTGGTMYAKLPFDQPMTIRLLGEKLFTRIKDPDEQALIRAFLAQEP
jgi:hypothetical protein